MSSKMSIYRRNNPEKYELEKEKNRIRNFLRYQIDQEHRENKIKYGIDRYKKMIELKKAQETIQQSDNVET